MGDAKNYVCSMFGRLKLVQLVLCFLLFLFPLILGVWLFNTVLASVFLVATLVLFAVYALFLDQFNKTIWLILELVFNGAAVILFFIFSTIEAIMSPAYPLEISATIGFVTCIAYGVAGFLAIRKYKSGDDSAGVPA